MCDVIVETRHKHSGMRAYSAHKSITEPLPLLVDVAYCSVGGVLESGRRTLPTESTYF